MVKIKYDTKGGNIMLIGYTIINPNEVNSYKQIDALVKIGVDMRKIYQDKIEEGIRSREKLNKMLEELQEGDIVIVTELVRLGGSTKELLEIVEKIGCRGSNIISLKEQWFNTTNASGALMYEILQGIVQFEQELGSVKTDESAETNESIEIQKASSKLGGRPKKATEEIEKAILLYNEHNLSVKEIEVLTGVSRATLYRYLNEAKKD